MLEESEKVTAEKWQASVWQNSRKRIRRQFLGLLRLWAFKGEKRKMQKPLLIALQQLRFDPEPFSPSFTLLQLFETKKKGKIVICLRLLMVVFLETSELPIQCQL